MANKSPFRLTSDSPDQESQAQLPKRNCKCPGCKSLHGEHSRHIIIIFCNTCFVHCAILFILVCNIHHVLSPVLPSLCSCNGTGSLNSLPCPWAKEPFFSIFLASLDLGQIVAVKLQCLNFFVEKKCVIEMYEKGKISCVWIMKWYFKVH